MLLGFWLVVAVEAGTVIGLLSLRTYMRSGPRMGLEGLVALPLWTFLGGAALGLLLFWRGVGPLSRGLRALSVLLALLGLAALVLVRIG